LLFRDHLKKGNKSKQIIEMIQSVLLTTTKSYSLFRRKAMIPSVWAKSITSGNVSLSSSDWNHYGYSSSSSQHRPFSDTNTNNTSLAKTSKDGVVGHPIDFDVHSKIEGNESQIVTIEIEPGQVLRAESGAMMYMTDGVTMNTTTGGGLSEGFRRMMTGQNFFISDYTYDGEPGTTGIVALGTEFPSKIIRLNVEEYGGKLVCQKGALL
jgi:hypothetical protein